MKKGPVLILTVWLVLGLVMTGCGTKKAASGKEAIDTAKAMETSEQKADYLISQAKAFYNSEEFHDVVDIAQYILRYVDKDSEEAKKLLDDATEALLAQLKERMPGF